jgi:transformer-2 protein
VVGCHVVLEPHTRVSRGFAFVTMDTVEDADRCIKHLNNTEMEGRTITVEKVIVCTSLGLLTLTVRPHMSCMLT